MKAPLTFGEGSNREWYILDADENWIAEAVPNEPGEAEETARRITACVNACDGLDTTLLEMVALKATCEAVRQYPGMVEYVGTQFMAMLDAAIETPNVELTGAARLYRAASSD